MSKSQRQNDKEIIFEGRECSRCGSPWGFTLDGDSTETCENCGSYGTMLPVCFFEKSNVPYYHLV